MISLFLLAGLVSADVGAEAAKIKPVWTQKIGGDAGPHQLSSENGVLMGVTWEGEVQGRDVATGKKLWSRKPATKPAGYDVPQIAHVGGVVTLRWPDEAELEGRDARTGDKKWTVKLPAASVGLVACEEHRAVVATHRGQGPDGPTLLASAFDPDTGTPLWSVPVGGTVQGAGGAYVFATKDTDWGMIQAGLTAIDCADGSITSIRGADREYVRFLHATKGEVAAVYFARGYGQQQLCAGAVGKPLHCLPSTDGQVADYSVKAGLLKDGSLYFTTQHDSAHNLDKSPDGWLFRYDLAEKRFVWRSKPLTGGHALADAGKTIATGFGTTGIDDFFYLVRPEDGARLHVLPLKKAPSALTTDGERAYIASYDGKTSAVRLPGFGLKARPRAEVKPQVLPEIPEAADPLGWKLLSVIDAHPKKGRSSGQKGAGMVLDLAFLDPAGKRIAVGGNDDRVHVLDVTQGKEVWKSGKLGKDVYSVQACASGTFAAQIYGGPIYVFEAKGERYRKRKKIKHSGGSTFGFESGCRYVIADTYGGEFKLYDAITGKAAASFEAAGEFDRRGVRVSDRGIIVSRRGKLERIGLADLSEGPSATAELPTPKVAHGGELVQAFAINKDVWVREYCSAAKCAVEIVSPKGKIKSVETFDTRGGVWSPTVPSTIATEPGGRWLVWHRRGLEMQLLDLSLKKRTTLPGLPSAMSEAPQVAFSRDGRRIAIAMSPKSWQVTILEHSP